MSFKRYTRIFYMILMLLVSGAGEAWADLADNITTEVKPDNSAGSLTVTNVNGREVTLTVTPESNYYIKASDIIVEPLVGTNNANAPERRAPGLANQITGTLYNDAIDREDENIINSVSGTNSAYYVFTLPEQYDGAYVTATFTAAAGEIRIPGNTVTYVANGHYILEDDINASDLGALFTGSQTTAFSGTFEGVAKADGTFPKIKNLNQPLFNTATDATIKNIVLDEVNISQSGKTGSIACIANGDTRIYNCGILSGSVKSTGTSSEKSSTDCCGGLVGELSGSARVINCYSFANIKGGNRVGGIVGYNNGTTNASSITTMVMNCMFYGDITNGNKVSPVYGGNKIGNTGTNALNTYTYYAYDKLHSENSETIDFPNCALAVKEQNLTRFEYYRQLLNSNRKLAALYALNNATKGEGENSEMAKWVLDRDIAPYPILKKQGKYPSIINYDPERTYDEESGRMVSRSRYDSENNRNKGGTMGTLDVRISNVGDNAPTGARLVKYSLRLVRTDKDYDDYNFNYDKVQLPYYNDVGIGNYTSNKVVTGWKITNVTIGSGDDVATQGTFTAADEWNGYNFADRKTYAKDIYSSTNPRVFSQGAYFDVPYGATAITIEPYWGTAAYICDPNYDVVVAFNSGDNSGTNVDVLSAGTQGNSLLASGQTIYNVLGDGQNIFNKISTALGTLSGETVYDNALVLVGNLHLWNVPSGESKPFTIMSVDLDKDNEPDYSLIYTHYNRTPVSPIRFDFLNVPGMAMAQKPDNAGTDKIRNVPIFRHTGWFEVTNTCLVSFSQLEYESLATGVTKSDAPVILLGGEYEQFVSTQNSTPSHTLYIHVGSNAYFKDFSNGTHSDGWYATKHIPISATGGDYETFYLSGAYRPDAQVPQDDAECYISGGRFGEVAGAGQQQIDGNVRWQIYDADIRDFYGGGINDEKPITGNIIVDIFNSHVTTYCGGPKFGDMQKRDTITITFATNKAGSTTGSRPKEIDEDRTVTTNAYGCTFNEYFGAGYGGISYVRKRTQDESSINKWSTWESDYTNNKGKYFDGTTTHIGDNSNDPKGSKGGPGVAVDFDYEFFIWSTGKSGGRFYNKYASLSLATTNDVESNLYGCNITHNFYGGGHLGKVDGTITSNLNGCTVGGNVFGAGFSADKPIVPYTFGGFATNSYPSIDADIFNYGAKTTDIKNLELKQVASTALVNNESAIEIYGTPKIVNGVTIHGSINTDVKLDELGTAADKVTLNIKDYTVGSTTKSTTITGNVYGGGESSAATGDVEVNIHNGTMTNVYGGGDQGKVGGATQVNLINGSVTGSVYGGGNLAHVAGNVTVNMTGGTVTKDVYGGGALANTNIGNVTGYGTANETIPNTTTKTTTVNLQGGTINGDAYGGGLGRKAATGVEAVEATVYGDITVNLGAADASVAATAFNITNYTTEGHTDVVKSGRLFGANNLNGSPKGNVTVNVYKTVEGNHSRTATEAYKKKEGDDGYEAPTYEVAAVYGGGNLADYTTAGKKATVNIETCNVSVESVYGGGNAAAVPATDVNVNGAYEIQYVFGGGNGKDPYTLDDGEHWTDNGGANVNGNAYTMLTGGFIHEAYGASNQKGTITGTATLQAEDAGNTGCALDVWKMVGAGKNADINGDVNLVLGCMPEAKVDKLYGGADNANVFGNVTLTITSGNFGDVYGGNNLSGIITGQIILNIEETGCRPIDIDNLYLGGNDAAYSVYGYYRDAADNNKLKPRSSLNDHTSTAIDAPSDQTSETQWYADPILNIRSFTRIGNVFGGGYGSGATIYGNPTVNINQAFGKAYEGTAPNQTYTAKATTLGAITNVFGGGEKAAVIGSTMVNIGTETTVDFETNPKHLGTYTKDETSGKYKDIPVSGVNITGDVFGGGKLADVTETTNVNICAKKGSDDTYSSVTPGSVGVTIGGDVFGGGQGVAAESGDDAFNCAKAMVGNNNTNSADNNDSDDYADKGTHVRIGNGTVTGNVYGGGEIARVEFHTNVMIGIGTGTGSTTKSPVIGGSVFGAGKGEKTHGYSGLVRGNSTVIIQGDAKVGESVYGGGEMASVGKYEVVNNLPTTHLFGGKCTVTIQGYAEIGPNDMTMTASGGPVNLGHVFGAGKGVLPYEDVTDNPWSMQSNNTKLTYTSANQDDYFNFIKTLALASNTEVTIAGNAFVKGSVYGGSQNGRVQANTQVKIQGGQIGAGYDATQGKSLAKYNEGVFIDPAGTPITSSNTLATCATWTYAANGYTYDKFASSTGTYSYNDYSFVPAAERLTSSEGGRPTATDGHTFYGNVFGGGSGYFPYAPGKWYKDAGYVGGNTEVRITGGHILSNVYGGNEQTDVNGTCTINMSGGSVGVPRTKAQIEGLPVIGCIFGAGKGDKRTLFNTWTNVASTSVNITGGIIYGSVYGGGEDGHILGNAVTTVEETNNKTITIGSTGDSGFDGNVFGGGRGSETSLTAGVVGGNVELTIESGKILGSVYGGGRLASVGTYLVDTKLENDSDNPNYGKLQTDVETEAVLYTAEDEEVIAGTKQVGDVKVPASTSTHGHINVHINGGHIGATNSDGSLITSTNSVGDVFGSGKGSTSNIRQFGLVKTTTVTMSGGQVNASVYGGGEVAIVDENTTVTINGGEVGDGETKKGGAKIGNVYGGGKGLTTDADAGLIKGNTQITVEDGTSTSPTIYHNIYGGGAYGSVGNITYDNATYVPGQESVANMPVSWTEGNGKAEVIIKGGTIGQDGDENGMIFGSSRGDVTTPTGSPAVDPNDKLAWVKETKVQIGTSGSTTGPDIRGSVYGSGENGHVFNNTNVEIHSGKIGVDANTTTYGSQSITDPATNTAYTGADYPKRGNVYGGGCGEDDYWIDANNNEVKDSGEKYYNPLAGIVIGNTNVTIDGGKVVHNVYGGGALGSVGTKAIVEISGGQVGDDGNNDGNVYGASRGNLNVTQAYIAQVAETEVQIKPNATPANSPVIWNDVFGGGEAGIVTGSVAVTVSGGEVKNDVYGGGALANTNTDNWDATKASYAYDVVTGLTVHQDSPAITGDNVSSYYTKSNRTYTQASGEAQSGVTYYSQRAITGDFKTTPPINGTSYYTTKVSLTGGKVGNAYGGGLGKWGTGVPYTPTECNTYNATLTGHKAAGETLTTEEAAAYNVQLTGAIASGAKLTSAQATAVNSALNLTGGDAYATDGTAEISAEHATAYNATLTGALSTTALSADNANAYNATLEGARTTSDWKVHPSDGTGNVKAMVYGDVTVTVNEKDNATYGTARFTIDSDEHSYQKKVRNAQNIEQTVTEKGTVYTKGRVFGCNNINGTPKGDVTVTVRKTLPQEGDTHIYTEDGGSYEIQGVYGGGNLANYEPATGKQTTVNIRGCGETSIQYVFGGGNAARVPETHVNIFGTFEIESVFGGGNGNEPICYSEETWVQSPGAEVMGDTNVRLMAGLMHQAFGGSFEKGTIYGQTNIDKNNEGGEGCTLKITDVFGGGKDADVNSVNIELSECNMAGLEGIGAGTGEGQQIENVYAGSYNARILGDVTMTVKSGTFKNIFGGNYNGGFINGQITLNVEETASCKPVRITNLYGGGNYAPYPGAGANNNNPKITINVKACTSIGNIYGGSYHADVNGDTEVNINMIKGWWAKKTYTWTEGQTEHSVVIPDAIGTIGNVFGGGDHGRIIGNTVVNIGTQTEIDLVTTPDTDTDPTHFVKNANNKYDVLGAKITGNVYGGGNYAEVTGNTQVNICAKENTSTHKYESVTEGASGVEISGTEWQYGVFGGGNLGKVGGDSYVYIGGGSVLQSVYGGGCEADVKGNTYVTMLDGYVDDGIYGGGLMGSVGTFTRASLPTGHTHGAGETCVGGKPDKWERETGDGTTSTTSDSGKNTGTCTVVVSGGQVGPTAAAQDGMNASTMVDLGFVFGAGRGNVENPDNDKDADFHCYVYNTDVTIKGTALIMASVYGGGENGRVRQNTLVNIEGGQIGCGNEQVTDGKPVRYTDGTGSSANQFVDPANMTDAAALAETSHWPFGKTVEGKTTKVYEPYDPYTDGAGDPYGAASTTAPSDGKTYYGSVFGGGSGYYPYVKEQTGETVTDYAWLPSAGLVEGNTVVNITGGHILTNVYGGNEYTDVKGSCTITMTGGTIGVPRTVAQIKDHPLSGIIFGAGKGDQREQFHEMTNVGSTIVSVEGGIVYGSVFGGAEDGHVLGNTSVSISGTAKIGTWGTSGLDGNVFGGGRGYSGETLGAGNVNGNASVNINGGTILGSVYGGGRMASIGTDFFNAQSATTGQFFEDETTGANPKTYGHATITIDGGTIGNDRGASNLDDKGHAIGGNVYGGSMGRLTSLDGTPSGLWVKMAQAKSSTININQSQDKTTLIKGNVYGGGEFGTTRDDATITVNNGTINGSVFGGGYGSDIDDEAYIGAIIAQTEDATITYLFNPMQYAGCMGRDTYVNIKGGQVKKNVYGGGEMASVGVIDYSVTEDDDGTITYKNKKYSYINVHKHADIRNAGEAGGVGETSEKVYGFGLSWPYEFNYVRGGKTTVNVTGGRIGTGWNDVTGYVFGGGKGKAFERYKEAHIANVRETAVNINYATTPSNANSTLAGNASTNCVAGAVYGGGEDGHVYENAAVTLTNGLVGLSIYGGGKGEGTYKGKLRTRTGSYAWKDTEEDLPSWTAGKVYGNTSVTMNGGHVLNNIYGGGNLGSVGKGNYAGGPDDYYPAGYGETLDRPGTDNDVNLWTSTVSNFENPTTPLDSAYYFLNSGKCTVTIKAGTVGTVNGTYGNVGGIESMATPTGLVFGGSRGKAAEDVGALSPRYAFAPDFFLGYVNSTEVTIGDATHSPTIYAQVFGGGRDGHVRNSTHVIINNGTIGQPYSTSTNDYQRLHRGNVFGSGSGLGSWNTTETKHGTSSGSVTRHTTVDIKGGLIYQNVYGGGATASVGPPKIGAIDDASNIITLCQVNIEGGTIGVAADHNTHNYGGNVYGASRGGELASGEKVSDYATVLWTDVNIKPGADIKGNVFGGGEAGQVKCGVTVNTTGGSIAHDLYGGGALANTNTSNLKQVTSNDEKVWTWTDDNKRTAKYTTTVNLRGGTISGDAYGGGLGRKEFGTEGQVGYVSPVEALVYGDVLLELNKEVAQDQRGCVVSRLFGCNNLNGSPQGHVTVHVYATQPAGEGKTIKAADKFAKFKKRSEYTTTNYSDNSADNDLTKLATTVGADVSSYTTILGTTSLEGIEGETNEEKEANLQKMKKTALENMIDAIAKKKYDVLAVYGGGNLAAYTPMGPGALPGSDTDITNLTTDYLHTEENTDVIIEGCELTSIKQVYGGGNAAPTPATYVIVNGSYEIDEVFGGGNGADNYTLEEGNNTIWYQNPGANVGYRNYTYYVKSGSTDPVYDSTTHGTGAKATPYTAITNDNAKDPIDPVSGDPDKEQGKQNRKTHYSYGSGVATTDIKGGKIHSVYGGSNKKGNISTTALSMYQGASDCPMDIDDTYGASKDAPIDGVVDQRLRCAHGIKEMFGGAKNADVDNDIHLTITNGSSLERVFGGNNTSGAINGTITVTIEEGGCEPIHIGELYAGGYLAPYSIYGYETNSDGSYRTENVSYIDQDGTTKSLAQRIPKTSGNNPRRDPIINVISASRIDEIFGGGYQAKMVGSPRVNVNMTNGFVEVTKTEKTESDDGTYAFTEGKGDNEKTYVYKDDVGNIYDYSKVNTGDFTIELPIGTIGTIYGGGNLADVIGDTYVEVGTGEWTNKNGQREMEGTIKLNNDDFTTTFTYDETMNKWTYIETVELEGAPTPTEGTLPETLTDGYQVQGTAEGVSTATIFTYHTTTTKWTYTRVASINGTPTPTRNEATITENVFGGGKGKADNYECDKAMVGQEDYGKGSTSVIIGNGTVGTIEDGKLKTGTGNVYGGGKIARVEKHTSVTIGLELKEGEERISAPDIKGSVFGAGQGIYTHGYSGLVRGHSTVTIQNHAKVGRSVYGGGEMATVGRFWVKGVNDTNFEDKDNAKYADVPIGMPYALMSGGECAVTVKDYAEVGPNDMKMTADGGPDDTGYVFGAGRGMLPYKDPDYNVINFVTESHSTSYPWRMDSNNHIQDYTDEAEYLRFIETLALANNTEVTIEGNAFIKGSVYGGSENGRVLNDTHVTIDGDCQIGNGYVQMAEDGTRLTNPLAVNRRYTDAEWAAGHLILGADDRDELKTLVGNTLYQNSLPECASWEYKTPYAAYDIYDLDANSKPKHATDGHTFYGNVFGGGSGLFPYKRNPNWTPKVSGGNVDENGYSDGVWHEGAGAVYGNTLVEIKGGHILTSVYGGNEMTNVGKTNDANTGKCTVKMSGGTLGVPRTLKQIEKHPVTCYLFGAGKGDQRINFNTSTNVNSVLVEVTDEARIYGSVFGGGEDGHVLGNVQLDVKSGKDIIVGTGDNAVTYRYPYIGTTGTSYVDGNIFGAGRGFSGDALTAGTVGGNVKVNISDGTMLGSVYGGGRLASVGTRFTAVTDPYYGQLQPDVAAQEATYYQQGDDIPEGKKVGDIKTPAVVAEAHGHVTVNISGGTIGNDLEDEVAHPKGGNVFGGSMGRLTLLDGSISRIWPKAAVVKTAKTNISGTALIKGNVYGGGELGMVRGDAHVTIGGVLGDDNSTIFSTASDNPVIKRNVFGGGYGSEDYTTRTTITARGFNEDEGVEGTKYTFTPMQLAGIVCGDTYLNIKRGSVKNNVYGGGEMATVGLIDFKNAVKHESVTDGFGLSWPYKMTFIPYDDSRVSKAVGGSTYVTVTGGRIGTSATSTPGVDNGNIYGGSKGKAGATSDYEFCGNAKNTYVTINYGSTPTEDDGSTTQLILGSVFGGAEDGHVIEDTHVSMQSGLITHSLFAGGRGQGTYMGTLKKLTDGTATSEMKIRGLTTGKVYGNTYLEMSGGAVWHNVFGGGFMASVGKGNYAGGADDYATGGYGETITGNLWTSTFNPAVDESPLNPKDNAWYFLNSGKTYLAITGGTIGKLDNQLWDDLPSGNVFGSSRGVSAPNITNFEKISPEYCPEFFSGYVNETYVTIGGDYRCVKKCTDKNGTVHIPGEALTESEVKTLFEGTDILDGTTPKVAYWEPITSDSPRIYGSVYGGGQDGHVRREAHVVVNKGEIGVPYTDANRETLGTNNLSLTEELDNPKWLLRGNVFGAGSGINPYRFDLDGDGEITKDKAVEVDGVSCKETGEYSTSAGSVTHFTQVDIMGGSNTIIHRNVYGGGSLGSVGPPAVSEGYDISRKDSNPALYGKQSQCTVNISGTIGTPTGYNQVYGGEVYGASRGLSSESPLGSVVWTQVNILNGAFIQGNVFGGGDNGMVKKDTDVRIGAPTSE